MLGVPEVGAEEEVGAWRESGHSQVSVSFSFWLLSVVVHRLNDVFIIVIVLGFLFVCFLLLLFSQKRRNAIPFWKRDILKKKVHVNNFSVLKKT